MLSESKQLASITEYLQLRQQKLQVGQPFRSYVPLHPPYNTHAVCTRRHVIYYTIATACIYDVSYREGRVAGRDVIYVSGRR